MSAVSSALRDRALVRAPRRAVIAVIQIYQAAVSPHLGPACRFEPSCSAYAIEAIARHGAIRGARLAAMRIARCHPCGGFGYDPVP